jgi:hypothetical protein
MLCGPLQRQFLRETTGYDHDPVFSVCWPDEEHLPGFVFLLLNLLSTVHLYLLDHSSPQRVHCAYKVPCTWLRRASTIILINLASRLQVTSTTRACVPNHNQGSCLVELPLAVIPSWRGKAMSRHRMRSPELVLIRPMNNRDPFGILMPMMKHSIE